MKAVDDGLSLRNSDEVTRAVKTGLIEARFTRPVDLKIFTPVVTEKSAPPRQPMPFPLVIGAKKEELAHFAAAMAQLSRGNGFRQPSAKAKKWQSTSLVEQLAIAFLGAEKNEFKRSDRGERKLKARNETKAIILLDRLIERAPARAAQAKRDERMLNWIVATIEQAYLGETDAEWREWLRDEAKKRLDGRDPKYLHAVERAMQEYAQEADMAA